MGVSFAQPWWWLFLPVVLAIALYLRLPWLRMARKIGGAFWTGELWRFFLRILIFFLLTAVLSGTSLVGAGREQAVIFVLAVSASIGGAKSQAEQWVRAALEEKPPAVLAGVVSFGKQALVEVSPGQHPSFFKLGTEPGEGASRIGEGLTLAQALFPPEVRKRVVLLSDGRDTQGDAETAAARLRAEGVRVDVVPLGETGPDVRVANVKLPPRARVGETVTVEATAVSGRDGAATLFLERDGAVAGSAAVNLRAGENHFSIPVEAGQPGLHSYQVTLVAKDKKIDTFPFNNGAGAAQEVTGPPRALFIATEPGETEPLARSLKAAGQVDIDVVGPDLLPRGIASWARYQAVFLVNVAACELGEEAMAEIEACVRDGGAGLVMIGGPNSFGPGGYGGTPVEKALPVKMDISGQGELPSLGLVLVIDKSGSMGGYAGGADKIDLAKEAAVRTLSDLTGEDRAGVIAFDTWPWWVVPLGAVDDKNKIRAEIGGIYAGGGTEIFSALVAAYEALKDAPTRIKHIILLTDGRSASGGAYQELLTAMRGAGVTLTCVAVGEGADAGMLKAISELGRGRFYATSDAQNIPSIFTKEKALAVRNFAVDEGFVPRVSSPSALLQGIGQAPALEGYIATAPKDRAELALISHRGDPVLAAWQYGLGRAVAWAPDAAGRWSRSWINSPAFPRLWGNVLSWILPAVNTGSVQITAKVDDRGDVQITVDDPARGEQLGGYSLVVRKPDGNTENVSLALAGPGIYTARLREPEEGVYLVSLLARDGKEQSLLARTSLTIPYPAEYKETGVDLDNLHRIANAGGGEEIHSPGQAFAPNLPPVRASRDLTGLLVIFAGGLWLLDVAARRLKFGAEERAIFKRMWKSAGYKARKAVDKAFFPGEKPVSSWAGQVLNKVKRRRAPLKEAARKTGVHAEPPGQEKESKVDQGELSSPAPALPRTPPHKIQETGPQKDTTAALLVAKRRRKKKGL